MILNVIARRPKIRSSGDRWVTFSNRSIIWAFGVFFGALAAGLPTLFGLISQYPYAVLAISAIFLVFVFETIYLNEETDELVKPEAVKKTKLTKEKQAKHLKSDAVKHVRQFGEKHSRSLVFVLAVSAGLIVAYFSIGDDRQTLSIAAQSMVPLASFLAGASGVLTAIYLRQILTELPETVRQAIPSLRDMIAQGVAGTVGSATNPDEQAQLARKGMESGINDWKSMLRGQMSGARRIRNVGIYALILLVASAISSILVILTGFAIFLGASVSFVILATWTIFRSWKTAEESIEDTVFVSSLVG